MWGWIAAASMIIGAAFMLVAAIGVWRFPDVLTRMQAATKAGTLGVGFLMVAVALHFAQLTVTAHVVLIALFFMLTQPVAGHRIGRAAHRIGVSLWEGTQGDELREAQAAAGAGGEAGAVVGGAAAKRENDVDKRGG